MSGHYAGLFQRFEQKQRVLTLLNSLNINQKGYFLCTLHRQENTDDRERFGFLINCMNKLSKIKKNYFSHSSSN